MKLYLLISYISLIFGVFARNFDNNVYYSVRCKENLRNSCSLEVGKPILNNHKVDDVANDIHAFGIYEDSIHEEGWGKLWVHSDNTTIGWYQAGYLEGSLTALRIYQHFTSWYNYQFGGNDATKETIAFILEQYEYSLRLVEENPNDIYYIRLGQVLAQFQGILDGVRDSLHKDRTLSLTQLLLLEAAGDLYEIISAVNTNEYKLHIGRLNKNDFYEEWHKSISCSALIKMTDDKLDVFAGHTTWTSYQNMLRIYKNYDLSNGDYQTSHSSKPGVIYSKDDFYVLPHKDKKMVIMETTNGVLNSELLKLVTTQSLLTWQRIPLTNSLATSGKSWTSIFSRHNSGTYANQWMVVDMKEFIQGSGPSSTNFLWIVEVAPGIAAASDVTSVFINNGNVWPSYNIPFTESVYVETGFENAYLTYGNQYSYLNNSRAQMFARDQSSIQSFTDMQSEMRQNNYQTDPLCNDDPYNAISSRKDLRTNNTSSTSASTSGGIDSKITSYTRILQDITTTTLYLPIVSAQSGPTAHDTTNQLPVFQWSTSIWKDEIHLGQPDTFDFPFIDMDFYEY